ncbi:SRPBCC domain-containing protein [Lacihabitans sp. CS3-21]|uniref:SRPBCC domain-containing protein n=1 Tax=Lacihabitans sp. CS3-21 TaxID=2487332 RepID=UPI0020CCC03D|nr:SRPBCC domain-containing protein [Lacihabitans sp. CS3-21]MCP9748917.1 activator of HSP90 ATPase [Lacihabitans sp. CS3-21]
MTNNPFLKVEITINKPVDLVWECWTNPADIMLWNVPFPNWHSPKVENNLRAGGLFSFRMEAIDGSEGFDHTGKYDKVIKNQLIEYTLSDNRKSRIEFVANGNTTSLTETFEPEKETPIDLQRDFCESVLLNFKQHVESKLL